jgi:PiT family inorganic phosphate transporter
MGFLFLTSGLFLGWSLGANDHGNVFGAAVQTKMIKFKYAALIGSIFVILGAVAEGSGGSATLNQLGSVNAAAGTFAVALATAITVALMTKLMLPVSTSQAIVGGIIGWNLFAEMLTDYSSLTKIVISWVAAPFLAAVFSFLLYYVFKYYLGRSKLHLLSLDTYNRWWLIIIGAFGAYSLGANNIANVVGIFVNNSPFKDIVLFQTIHITGLQQLYFWGAISIAVGIYTYSQKVITTIGSDVFKLSPMTGLIVVLAESLVLYLFGSKGLQNLLISLHLPTIPLVPISSSQAVIGAVLGIGLVKGGRNINFSTLGKISMGWITTPLMACLLTFVMLFFVQNVFEQPVVNKIYYQFGREELVKLKDRGINLDYLTEVNGREYQSAQSLRRSLNKIKQLNQKQKLILTNVAEIHRLKVNAAEFKTQLRPKTFTDSQWAAIDKLDGKKYIHKWQLEDDLMKLSPEWKFKPKSYKNQFYNEDLKSRYSIIINISKMKEVAPADNLQ